ncbi:MAG TPA: DLW-39 family protein [Actinomycetes bacterium]|nr:DLW-39 family protein [Actinomycetes bacterium]
MKKLLVLVALAGVAFGAWRKYQSSRAEEDLWIEATRDETLDLR